MSSDATASFTSDAEDGAGRGDLDHKDGVKGRIMLRIFYFTEAFEWKTTNGFNWDFKKINGPINGDLKGTSIIIHL